MAARWTRAVVFDAAVGLMPERGDQRHPATGVGWPEGWPDDGLQRQRVSAR
jgi:hypothetical protein